MSHTGVTSTAVQRNPSQLLVTVGLEFLMTESCSCLDLADPDIEDCSRGALFLVQKELLGTPISLALTFWAARGNSQQGFHVLGGSLPGSVPCSSYNFFNPPKIEHHIRFLKIS